jgi:hypothetical protein
LRSAASAGCSPAAAWARRRTGRRSVMQRCSRGEGGAPERDPSRRSRRGRYGNGCPTGLMAGRARAEDRAGAAARTERGVAGRGRGTAAPERTPVRVRTGHCGCRCGRRVSRRGGGDDARVAGPSRCRTIRPPERPAGAPAAHVPVRLCGRGAERPARRRDGPGRRSGGPVRVRGPAAAPAGVRRYECDDACCRAQPASGRPRRAGPTWPLHSMASLPA